MSNTPHHRRFIALLILATFVFVSTSVFPTAHADAVKVVCTNSVLGDFAEQLLGSEADVEFIMPGGACPTHFDTKPSDISTIEDADIVISLGIEPWLESLITASGNDDTIRIVTTGLRVWNIPSGAKQFVNKIAMDLGEALPELNDTIQANAASFKNSIDSKATELQDKVHASGLEGKPVACMEWQKAFIEWLGFEVAGYYPPPESMSTADILNITSTVENSEVVAIIDNLQSGTEFGGNLASDLGVAHVIFTNFPGGFPNTYTYLDMIEYNTNQLINGIASHEQASVEIADLQLQRTALLVTATIFAILSIVLGVLYVRKR